MFICSFWDVLLLDRLQGANVDGLRVFEGGKVGESGGGEGQKMSQPQFVFPRSLKRFQPFCPLRFLSAERACWARPSFAPFSHLVRDAILFEDVSEVKRLLALGADPNGVALPYPYPHLLTAAMTNRESNRLVTLLLAHGADVDKKDKLQQTTLMIVWRFSFVPVETVETLIRAGANVNHRDVWGNTALESALERQRLTTRTDAPALQRRQRIDLIIALLQGNQGVDVP